jgi:hypothetical protein
MNDVRATIIVDGDNWLNGDISEHPMTALLAEIERSLQEPTSGEIRTGTSLKCDPNEVLGRHRLQVGRRCLRP